MKENHMSEDERMLKCRFCDHTIPAVIRYKNGNTKSGAEAMTSHVRVEHPNQLKATPQPPRIGGGRGSKRSVDNQGLDNFARPSPVDKIFR